MALTMKELGLAEQKEVQAELGWARQTIDIIGNKLFATKITKFHEEFVHLRDLRDYSR